MSITTKKGDKGKTELIDNKKRVGKDSQIIKTIGVLDEVNSYLGVCVSSLSVESKSKREIIRKLQSIQKDLFTIGAIVAGIELSSTGGKLDWKKRRVIEIETEIKQIEVKLPIQKHFILPGGCEIAARLMYARALVRRAERELITLKRNYKFPTYVGRKVPHSIFQFVNRLSDYLFLLARYENAKNKIKETVWIG